MKTLILMRHAKSSWSDSDLSDYDRPLNERGKRDAPRMGQLLAEKNVLPELILASAATRARKTAASVAQTMNFNGKVHFDENLYLATPGQIIDAVNQLPDEHRSVMLVAHNPGMEQLVTALSGQLERFPTAAVAHIKLPVEKWADLQVTTPGDLVNIWRPKEL